MSTNNDKKKTAFTEKMGYFIAASLISCGIAICIGVTVKILTWMF